MQEVLAHLRVLLAVVREFTTRFEKPIWVVLAIALVVAWAGTHQLGWPMWAWTAPWTVALVYLALWVHDKGSRYLWIPLALLAAYNASDTIRHLRGS